MNNHDEIDLELQKLKQSILDTSHGKITDKSNSRKEPYSFNKQLTQRIKNQNMETESSKEIDILEAGDYLKLLCHQKKYLSKRRHEKITSLNESLLIEQESFKYLFMISTQANYFKLEYPGYYEQILEQLSKYPKNMFSAIEKDIPRTFPNGHPLQESLKNILLAFAVRNPNILYCQGMNYVVAYFLINSLSQEETFWIMNCLVENILPDDYFKDLSTISITTQIFSDVLPHIFPDMGREMKNMGMDCSLFVVTWYVCLFTKGFINSVSSYLFTKLILETRKHSFGFALLKLSLGVIAAILGRDEPFTFKPQFGTFFVNLGAFRDKFQLSVFEISLLEIKLGVEYVELNEENYLKLEKHYRDRRQNRHSQAIQRDMRNRRLTLPICSSQFPICLHRIQIERKLGRISEVTINRNAYKIQSQYIENYFDSEPKKETTCTTYTTVEDCLMYRHNHVCQMGFFESFECEDFDRLDGKIKLRHDESFIKERKYSLQRKRSEAFEECYSPVQIIKQKGDNDDQKLRELSGYFVVDKDFKFNSEQDVQEEFMHGKQIEIEIKPFEMPNIPSSSSLDEPFDLEKELEKHHIERDWMKHNDEAIMTLEEQLKSIEEIKEPSNDDISSQKSTDSKSSGVNKNQPNEEKKQPEIPEIQQVPQITFSEQKTPQSTLNVSENQNQFFSKAKIWNFFDRTWQKVSKIKEEQLKN